MIFPAHHGAPKIMEPREQALDLPAAAITAQGASVLSDRFAAVPPVRRDQFYPPEFPASADPTDHYRRLCHRSVAQEFLGGIFVGAWARRGWLHLV